MARFFFGIGDQAHYVVVNAAFGGDDTLFVGQDRSADLRKHYRPLWENFRTKFAPSIIADVVHCLEQRAFVSGQVHVADLVEGKIPLRLALVFLGEARAGLDCAYFP